MTYCTTCGTPRESGSRFCTGCGEQVNAASSTRSDSRRRVVVALSALALLVGGGIAAWTTLAHSTSLPGPPSSDTPPHQAQATPSEPSRNAWALLSNAHASASCVSKSRPDASGTVFSYEPQKAIDNVRETAWRCDKDGVGQSLKIDFQKTVTLTEIGMVPGYAKTDMKDGTDRYAQNRRISAVKYTFDDGSTFLQDFDTSVLRRDPQTRALPNVSTSHVTITILSSVSGEANNGQPPFDQVAISEITISVL